MAEVRDIRLIPTALQGRDPYEAAGFGPGPPAAAPSPEGTAQGGDPYAAAGFGPAPPERPEHAPVGLGEAVGTGALNGVTFGAFPAIRGATEAAMAGASPQEQDQYSSNPDLAMGLPIAGLIKVLSGDEKGKAAYDEARKAALADQQAAQEQHPIGYMGGQVLGSIATPAIAGVGAPATLGGRLIAGGVSGGVGGGLYGAGDALSEGKSAPEIAQSAATNAVIGGLAGGAINGVIGPRLVNAASPGQRAARTAEALGAPLPRGLVSDRPMVQNVTAKARQIPFAGERIGTRAAETVRAAGGKINEIAGDLTGGLTDRAASDAILRPSLKNVITDNKDRINQAYSGLRQSINADQKYTLPATEAALKEITRRRAAAGWPDPKAGLEQVENLVTSGGSFNGVHRLRSDMREAGKTAVPHPGYNAGDFRYIKAAIDKDLRGIVSAAATHSPNRALKAFSDAEQIAQRLIDQNGKLQKLVDSKGEGLIASLVAAGKEKSGNLRLLAELKHGLQPDEFQQISGVMLHELGFNATAPEQFSLKQFQRGWDSLSPRAKAIMFSPEHQKWIEDIAQLARHIRGGDQFLNHSNTSGGLILYEMVNAAAAGASGVFTGTASLTQMGAHAAAASVPMAFAYYLSRPATAASMGAWSRAYQAVAFGKPTPARIAAFNLATRNLANNLGLDPVKYIRQAQSAIQGALPGKAEPSEQNQ